MEEKYGLENLKKVFGLLIELGNVGGEVAAMEKPANWYERLAPVVKHGTTLINDVILVVGVDWKLFPKELGDISAAEMEELKTFFVESFDIPSDKVEGIIELSLSVLVSTVSNVIQIIQLSKTVQEVRA